ncbi:MAG: beta-ketoacyl-[acyl-carrier-protein] synthase II, partial [Desulfovibrionaceae bacterium]
AKIAPEQLTHINAHGTSTTLNDLCESRAIKDVFGEHAYKMPICSNKSQIGHLLGGAGGVEGVFTTLSIANSTVPSTVNLETPDPDCDLDYVPEGPRHCDIEYALSNSFGFGGTNACVVFKKFEG